MCSQLPFIVQYNGGSAYHIEGKTWTIRSVDCSAKASSGAMWSLMQPKLTGAHLELTGTAGCCGILDDSCEGTEASLQCVGCCVSQEGPLAGTHRWSQASSLHLSGTMPELTGTVQRCLLCLGQS